MAIEDEIGKKALSGVDRLLLAPGFFVFEILAVLIPGTVFSVLLVLKGEYHAQLTLNSVVFGYKTKIALGLMFSYVVGKVLETPGLILERLSSYLFVKKSKDASQPQFQHELGKKFMAGIFFLPGLFSKSHALEYVVLERTKQFFSMDCGTALMLAAASPGDGNLRIVELVVGAFFILRGYMGVKEVPGVMVTMMGLSMTTEFEKLTPKGLLSVLPGLAHMMQDTPPPATPAAATPTPTSSAAAPPVPPASPAPAK
jgi:hypothetical protein